MEIISKLFGKKKSIAGVIKKTQGNLFKLHGVASPTDAQKMKASVYLCISGMAILNDLGGGRLRSAIDALVNETREITKSYYMAVNELANNSNELRKILSDFPAEAPITESTKINGLAAFEAMYFSLGKDVMNDILANKEGPMGPTGYAAIVVVEGIFGEGKSKEHFMESSMEMLSFIKELTEII